MRKYGKDTWQDITKRVLHIITEIEAGNHPNAVKLAKDLDLHPRTVRRMIRGLREDFGAPIEFDTGENGFYFSKKWKLY